MIPRLVAVAAGLWLLIAPAVLDHGGQGADNDRIVGPVVASLAFVALWPLGRPLRWATLPLGVWLVAAPLVVDYGSGEAAASAVASGLAVLVTAPFGGGTAHAFGGGWSSLVRDSSPGR